MPDDQKSRQRLNTYQLWMLATCQHLSTILQCFNEGASSEIASPRFFKDNIYLELPRFVR